MKYQKKVLLLILDGVGVAPRSNGNAITTAEPKTLVKLWETYPSTYLEASGEAVGLVENTVGNSEVGHLTLGSGKVQYQNLLKINNSIEKGKFFTNETLKNLLNHSLKHNSKIHLMGCLSDGSVHSHIDHLIAVLQFLHQQNFKGDVLIHAFTDGRDTPQRAAKKFLQSIQKSLDSMKIGRIASLCGRAYAMDRNNTTERTQKAADMLIESKGYVFKDWQEAIQDAYSKGENDEYIEPRLIQENTSIQNNDAVLFMNFRPDRAIQLSRSITDSKLENIFFAGMAEYQKSFPENVIFPKEYISLPIGRIVSEAGYTQVRIAESEKFPHVTYFFNGGQPIQYNGENRIRIPSPNVNTYDEKPEMSAFGVFNALEQSMRNQTKNYRLAVVNIANGDMIGHTGNFDAALKAMQTVDEIVSKTVKLARMLHWTIIITADHGNVERMIEPSTNLVNTEHTLNPVPFILVDDEISRKTGSRLNLGSLSDVTPTILKLMGIEIPGGITGRPII